MKTCNMCKEEKPLEDFHSNKRKKDGKQGCCKPCASIRNRKYHNTSIKYRERKREIRLESGRRVRQFLLDYLRKHPCVDCGESDPVVLDFDHVEGKKSWNISEMRKRKFAISSIEKEICKCQVRCANCHRKVTAIRGNFYRDLV